MSEKHIIDNLKKFGSEFQIKCISGLVSDRPFIERLADIVEADFFESDAHKWIVKESIQYFLDYKDLPTLNVFKVKLEHITNEVLKQSIINNLKVVYMKMNDGDLTFIKEQFLEFCKNQKLKNAISESMDLLVTGEYEKIKIKVDDALKAGMERNIGHSYDEDVDKRMTLMARNSIPTNWEVVDSLMDGGLGPGELGVITACAGGGKSWVLARIGAEAMKQNKNVIHFTLELNENYVGLRYDACFTGIDFQNIRNNIDVVKKKIGEVPGKLKIKYFPIKTVSAHNIKNHCERIQMLGTKIDMVIVDYADILRPMNSDRNNNSYQEAGGIYEELRCVAGEMQVPIWTASQSNRCLFIQTIVNEEVRGKIEIKDLMVNDKVLTNNGYKKVSHIFPIKKQPVYRVKLKSGKYIECSINHRFPVQYGKMKSIETGLSVGDKLLIRK